MIFDTKLNAIIDKDTDDFILHQKENYYSKRKQKWINHKFSQRKVKTNNNQIFYEVDKNIVDEYWENFKNWANSNHIEGFHEEIDENGDVIPGTIAKPDDSIYIVLTGKWMFGRQWVADNLEEMALFFQNLTEKKKIRKKFKRKKK